MGEPPKSKIQARDSSASHAFGNLLCTTQAALTAFVCSLIGSSEDARDIVQEVYIAAWQAAQRGNEPFSRPDDVAGVRRWLYRVAYYHAAMLLRHRNVLPWHSLDETDEARVLAPLGRLGSTEPFEDQVVEGEVLRVALARLSPEDAACVLLCMVQGFATREAAEILAIAPDAARKRLSRAMKRLRIAYFAEEDPHTHPKERADS
jgi:RNA polymerase sigma-70 factor, ECF subfamily